MPLPFGETQDQQTTVQRLEHRAAEGRAQGRLLDSAYENLTRSLRAPLEPWELASIAELHEKGEWDELNDRFFKALTFGTGGLRGRSIGRVVTAAERGEATGDARPEYPAVGTNCMNYRNVRAAARGLVGLLKTRYPNESLRVAVSFDSRLFSKEFAEHVVEQCLADGCDVFVFGAPASSPQLAFVVRRHDCHAGVMITASHNPPHDNGFKAYAQDGSQVLAEDAAAIAAGMTRSAPVESATRVHSGNVTRLDADADSAYRDALHELVVDPSVMRQRNPPVRLAFSPLHGTGIRIIPSVLGALGVDVTVVEEQATLDGRFPTVAAPNPEKAAAFDRTIRVANEAKVAYGIATDPDADRIGLAVRRGAGPEFGLLTGNETAALLADYRLRALFSTGTLNATNARHAAIVKTFVTTDLLRAIADKWGVRCVDTLTGFKYIGAKLRYYAGLARGERGDGGATAALARAEALSSSTYLVLGCEESYGYLAGDYIRDKDANGAAVMIAEMIAGNTSDLFQRLEEIYLEYGYYANSLENLEFEGSKGAAAMARALESLRGEPPRAFGAHAVVRVQDFSVGDIRDEDGMLVPTELMFRYHLEHAGHVTIRGSGTEPKLKVYVSLRAGATDRPELHERKTALAALATDVQHLVRAEVLARAR